MKRKYVKLSPGKFNNLTTCFQAVRILDHVAEIALEKKDPKLMFKVADKFVELAARLSFGPDEEEPQEEVKANPIGFQRNEEVNGEG